VLFTTGAETKRFGVGILGKQTEGTFSKSLPVSYGEHVVQVHLSSAADGFDQAKRYRVNLSLSAAFIRCSILHSKVVTG